MVNETISELDAAHTEIVYNVTQITCLAKQYQLSAQCFYDGGYSASCNPEIYAQVCNTTGTTPGTGTENPPPSGPSQEPESETTPVIPRESSESTVYMPPESTVYVPPGAGSTKGQESTHIESTAGGHETTILSTGTTSL